MAPTLKYDTGDNVLCSWDSIKFQAKVIKVDSSRRTAPYLVHYQGWKSRWDEWVPEGRLSGKGSGGKKSKTKKEKQPQSSSSSRNLPVFDENPEEDEDPPPTLERVVENGKVVYRTSDGKSLKTMNEMKKFCDRMDLLFDATDYDFSPPPEPVKPTRAVKATTSASGTKKSAKSPVKAKGKALAGRGLVDDLKEIQKAINSHSGAPSSSSNREDIEMEVSVEMHDFKGVTTNLLEEGESFTTSPKRGRPPRQKRPNLRYSESGTGSVSPEPSRKTGSPEKIPVGSPKKSKSPTKPKAGSVIKVKTTSPKNKKRKREEEEAQEEANVFNHPNYEAHPEDGLSAERMMGNEDSTEEFIEIQEHLHQQHNQQQEGFHQSISPPPILAQQVPPKRRVGEVRRLPSAGVGIGAQRSFQQPGFSVREAPVPKREFISAQASEAGYGYHESQEPLDEYEQFAHDHLHPQQQIVHHQARPDTVRTTSSFPLQGIRVTGQAPSADAPSRILMKLRAPEFKKSPRFKASLRVGPDGMEYIDSHYPPSIHTGGRGRFGVVGSGPPPAPIVPERLEDFCHLPAEVVGDHCYGKTPPVRAGGPVVTIRSHEDHHFGVGPIGKGYFSQPTRVHIAGPNLLSSRTIRVLPSGLVSSASLLHGTHHEASTAAAHLHSGAAGTFDDGGYSDGMAPPVLEGYVDGMEVDFETEEIEAGGSSSGSRLSPTVTLMPHSHHVPLLGDKLPANILEGVEDPDMGADPSMGIH